MNWLTDFLFKRPLGRVILAGLLLILGAYAGRVVLVDIPRHEEKEERASGDERLDQMADSLGEALSDRGDELAGTLPERTAWYPADLACDATEKAPAKREPVWNVLGIEAGEELAFQYRFEHDGQRFELRARRDTDCDGLYVVHTLSGRTDWSSVLGTEKSVQNLGE